MLIDQTTQRLHRLAVQQVGRGGDLVQHRLTVAFHHLHQVVTGAAKAMQRSLAHASSFSQFLERRPRAINDGQGQRLDESFVLGSQGHQSVSDRISMPGIVQEKLITATKTTEHE
ncbi:hypothetical protein D3C76_880640 [compost metagenome]